MTTPRDSFAPWQVAAAILTLVIVLRAAVALAAANPLAVLGLAPLLTASAYLIQRVLSAQRKR